MCVFLGGGSGRGGMQLKIPFWNVCDNGEL